MKINLSFKYVIAFLSLLFVMHELHEIAHTSIGRIICGCWGKRDFNVWELCEGCSKEHPISILATIAGPLFSFIMIFLGAWLLKKQKLNFKSLGFSLIFANMPFGRLLSAILSSGDEVYILETFGLNSITAHISGVLIITVIIFYPLTLTYKSISNKRKMIWFFGFLFLPLIIDILIVLIGLNTLLTKGFLSDYWILGSPVLVSRWTIFVILILIASYKNLYRLFLTDQPITK